MKNVVGLKEFRKNVDIWIKHVKHGNSVIVMKRSEPVFKISPVPKDIWQTVIDFTEFNPTAKQKKALVKAEDILKRLK